MPAPDRLGGGPGVGLEGGADVGGKLIERVGHRQRVAHGADLRLAFGRQASVFALAARGGWRARGAASPTPAWPRSSPASTASNIRKKNDEDGRDKPGHDGAAVQSDAIML